MPDLQQQYEEVRYNDFIAPLTDPAHLGALGRMFGLGTADPASCRALELGCGQGLNLIAMAARFPQSRFVGVDFIESSLQEGRALANAAGITNVELIQADLLAFDWTGEAFDYVIAWGVFSWVPDAVKERLLRITRACLAPGGLACICYLTYPGSKLIEPLRDLMRLRTDACNGFTEKVSAARAVLQTLQQAGAAMGRQDAAAQTWWRQADELLKKDPTVLFHDELGGVYDPCYLLQFVEWAQEHCLSYVTDADSPANVAAILPPAASQSLRALSDHALEQEQISDYLTNRTLRVSVLARDEDAPHIRFTAAAIQQLCLSTTLSPRTDRKLLRQARGAHHRFKDPRGQELTVDDRLTAAVLHALCEARGQRLPFATLLQTALAWIGDAAPAESGGDSNDEPATVAALGARLFPMMARKLVVMSLTATSVPSAPPDRLRLTPLNRTLLARRGMLATATHQMIKLTPAEAGWLLSLEQASTDADRDQMTAQSTLGHKQAAALLARAVSQGCLVAG